MAGGNITHWISKSNFVNIFPRSELVDGIPEITVHIVTWHDRTNSIGRMLGSEGTSMVKSLGGPIVDCSIAAVLMLFAAIFMGFGLEKLGTCLSSVTISIFV